jgi:hypothetical protein
MNRPKPASLKEYLTICRTGEEFWIVPWPSDMNHQAALESALKSGRRISAHKSLMEAAAELLRLRR